MRKNFFAIAALSLLGMLFTSSKLMASNVAEQSAAQIDSLCRNNCHQKTCKNEVSPVFGSSNLWVSLPNIDINGQEFSKNSYSIGFDLMFGIKGPWRAGLNVGYLAIMNPYQWNNSLFDRNYDVWKVGASGAMEHILWSNGGLTSISSNLQIGVGYTRLNMRTNASDAEKALLRGALSQKAMNGFFLDAAYQIKFNYGSLSLGFGYYLQGMSYKGSFAGLPQTKHSRSSLTAHGLLFTFGLRTF